jgi:signal transduction histidine kinase
MKSNFGNLITYTYLVGIFILFGIGIAAYSNFNSLLIKDKWVNHTQKVISISENLLSLLMKVENGARGYIISNDSVYLKSYLNCVPNIFSEINKLKLLTRDNKTQQKNLIELRTQVRQTLDFVRVALILKENNQSEELKSLFSSNNKRNKMESAMKTVDKILELEQIVLAERKIHLESSIAKTHNSIFLIILFALLLCVFTYAYSIRNVKLKEAYEVKLEKLNEALNNTVIDLRNTNIELKAMADKLTAANEEIQTINDQLLFTNNELVNKSKLLENSAIKLEKANKELEAFSYSVSHDLKAPLRTISGFANIMHREYGRQLDEEANRLISIIMGGAKRMGILIDDLLNFSKIGKVDLRLSNVNINMLVEDMLPEILGQYPELKYEVIINDLPTEDACDLSLIRQVWINLISNAIKFSSKNPKPRIEIGSVWKEDKLVYYVKDNGVGMDMKYAHKLFKVFQRLHKEEEFEGTGVGLAIIKRIITRHNGAVWVESKLNEGTIFYFYIDGCEELWQANFIQTVSLNRI